MRSLSVMRVCTTAAAISRTRKAGTSFAAPHQEQEPASEHATDLLDLPGTLLAQIWKQLEGTDRKSLYAQPLASGSAQVGHLALLCMHACRYQQHSSAPDSMMRAGMLRGG